MSALALAPVGLAQESLPPQLAGSWRIVRVLPTRTPGCWEGAAGLLGTTLTYRSTTMRWHGGEVPLNGVVTRTVTADLFEKETASAWGSPLRLAELNIQSPQVTEVDLQHDDADITGSTTEVPGDSVLLVGRNTIVVSACGTFFEATRSAPSAIRTAAQGTPDDRPYRAVKTTNQLSASLPKR